VTAARLGWGPAALLVVGAVLATAGVKAQRALPLRVQLSEAMPRQIEGIPSRDLALSNEEARVAGVTSYLVRNYQRSDSGSGMTFSVYVGYYDRQTQGRTIHSPKNCLPGAGWEPLASRPETVTTAAGVAVVNRYLLQRAREQALVLYWYQGRGRVAWNEYRVKWDLLRDAALRRRSDEALVRIVVPVRGTESEAAALAVRVARLLVPAVFSALPS
jgi:EpsI family protein